MEPDLIQILDPDGNCNEEAVSDLSESEIFKMYRLMVLTRLWNGKALSLQRQGRMGTLASVRGQEAANVGMTLPLQPGDWFVPAFREYGAMFAFGVTMKSQFLYWGGDERGARFPDDVRIVNPCITVGAHLCHAVGMAMAAKIRGERSAVLSSSGDGSTSQGDFHESLNWAGVFKAPVVFIIQNNHWAISLPFHKQTATKTVAEKAAAYGIEGIRVDGNDIFAVYKTVQRCADAARKDFRPALVELVTYRLDDHTTADDAGRYRDRSVVEEWEKKDPIDRMRKYLVNKRGWTEEKDKGLEQECAGEVEKAWKEAESIDSPDPLAMFDNMYTDMPWHLKEQREQLGQLIDGGEKK